MILFPFDQYWWFYAAFTAVVILLISFDLGVFNRKPRPITFLNALSWCGVWMGLAVLFAFFFRYFAEFSIAADPRLVGQDAPALAHQAMLEYLTGLVVEKSLAIDNVFVFAVIFTFFGVPEQFQRKVLLYGLFGALFFRGVFIALGSLVMQHHIVTVIFGVFLIFTGFKLFFAPEKPLEPEKNPLLKLLRKFLPITKDFHENSFIVKQNGIWHGTPLLVALVIIEFSDIVFAVDSVPAIFAITKEPLIVFTSNVFAILGLRALYFVLAGMMHRFTLLKYGLGVVLSFVGLKMVYLNDYFDGKFPTGVSLAIILSVISISVVASLIFTKGTKEVDTTTP